MHRRSIEPRRMVASPSWNEFDLCFIFCCFEQFWGWMSTSCPVQITLLSGMDALPSNYNLEEASISVFDWLRHLDSVYPNICHASFAAVSTSSIFAADPWSNLTVYPLRILQGQHWKVRSRARRLQTGQPLLEWVASQDSSCLAQFLIETKQFDPQRHLLRPQAQ